jgi:tryptophan 2,3-dioxygenase
MSVTYSSYLKIDELLALQQPRSEGPEHDEMLFIVIHQVYELWFKQILHEVALLQRSLEGDDTPIALATLKRILTILKTLVAQVDILETMTPISFGSFRARLETASGFQSVQFRELEFTLGHRNPGMLAHLPQGSEARRRLETLLTRPSLYDSFLRYLQLNGHPVPEAELERDLTRPRAESPAIQAILIDIYRTNPLNAQVCERMIDLDEGLQEWRYRHVKMVERTIGTKKGTGGSMGAEYLKSTIFRPLFPDLWAIRAEL